MRFDVADDFCFFFFCRNLFYSVFFLCYLEFIKQMNQPEWIYRKCWALQVEQGRKNTIKKETNCENEIAEQYKWGLLVFFFFIFVWSEVRLWNLAEYLNEFGINKFVINYCSSLVENKKVAPMRKKKFSEFERNNITKCFFLRFSLKFCLTPDNFSFKEDLKTFSVFWLRVFVIRLR